MRDGRLSRRRLGRSDLEISRAGFGTWAIGGPGWDYRGTANDDDRSIAAMLHAFDVGVNWVDTAPVYGNGHSEELVGRAIRKVRGERPFVFTKCGRYWDGPEALSRSDLRPASIRSGCEASLHRLGVETIDLVQFHWPDHDTGVPIEESWGELLHLVEEGKIRAAGVCNFDQALLGRCEAVGHVTSLQTPLSLIARSSGAGLLQWCAAHETSVIVYSPMQIGLLTDSFRADQVDGFATDDWRRRDPEFLPPKLQRNVALRDALEPIALAHSTTVGAVAVSWTLSWPEVTGAIVGARTPEQVDGWIAGAALRLTAADLELIAAAVVESGAGSGPIRPTGIDQL